MNTLVLKSSRRLRCAVVFIVPILAVLFLFYVQNQIPVVQWEESDEISRLKNSSHTELPAHTCQYNNVNNTVIDFKHVSGMNKIGTSGIRGGNLVCEKIDNARSAAQDGNLPLTVKITFGCNNLFEYSVIGTGNFLILLYGIRLVTQVYHNVDLFISCNDAEATKYDLIIPWITGYFPARPVSRKSAIPLTIHEACTRFGGLPIGFLYNEIQYDLRRMAIELVGVPSASHPSALYAKKYFQSDDAIASIVTTSPFGGCLALPNPKHDDIFTSISSKYIVDDAVVHFRCGDLMNTDHSGYRFMTFHGYTRHISPSAKTIGILTQPFEANTQSRPKDSSEIVRERCRIVVTALIEYIQIQYPNSQVNLRNDANETIAVTYARMIMANQTISGISSFNILPVIATFGTGYIQSQSDRHPWFNGINGTNDLILFNETKTIKVGNIRSLWETKGKDGVLDWFWNGTM